MYTWVSTEFPRHGIPSTRNSVDTDFPRHEIPSTQNSVDTKFRRHGIPSTLNSVDTEFRRHGIPPIFFTSIYSVCYAVIYFLPNFDGIPYTKIRGIPWN
jgi:hypothetical protein